jgi:hypothetical protein
MRDYETDTIFINNYWGFFPNIRTVRSCCNKLDSIKRPSSFDQR